MGRKSSALFDILWKKSIVRIGVFAGDLFWSSCPYECLNVYEDVSLRFNYDYIVFRNDIRLNKKFSGEEQFFFDVEKFKNCPGLRVIDTWNDFYNLTSDYDLILCRCKVAPKTRFPEDMGTKSKCPIVVWDVGGLDILTWEARHATRFLVKGRRWLDYLRQVKPDSENVSEVSLCPQYDPYYRKDLKHGLPISRIDFFKKYNVDLKKEIMLIAPSNPGSHVDHFNENLKILENISQAAEDNGYQVVIKTYPHDYVFYERESQYSGVYKRRYSNIPQYQFINDSLPSVRVIESQDHYAAMLYSKKVFNMSGSSIAWETFFTNGDCYSINFKNKPYYKNVKYLPKDVEFPDDIFNIDLSSHLEIYDKENTRKKEDAHDFFTTLQKDNIANKIRDIF